MIVCFFSSKAISTCDHALTCLALINAPPAQATVLAAVLVSVHGVHADGVGGLVHQGAVADGHHVTAQRRVQGGWGGKVVIPFTRLLK